MIPVLITEILHATGGTLLAGNISGTVTGVTTDSRNIKDGDLFVAICGEKADGHSFVNQALTKGAVCALVEKEVTAVTAKAVILVENTVRAMGAVAKLVAQKLSVPTVAITGSVGKTSTRDMTHAVMCAKYNTLKNDNNFNNEIGVPLTVFKADSGITAAVIEMGMDRFGEIDRLSSIVEPDVAVITNIGMSHIEHLGSQENIYKAKAELFANTKPEGTVILNGDDPILMAHRDEITQKVITVGVKNQAADLVATNIQTDASSVSFRVCGLGQDFIVKLPVPGSHNVLNALEAIACGIHFGVEAEEIAKALSGFSLTDMRMEIIKGERLTIINDCYNAAPASVAAALSVLSMYPERKVAILGDIGALGTYSYQAHKELGSTVVQNKIDLLITIGEHAKYIAEGAFLNGMDSLNIVSFDTVEEACQGLSSHLENKDVVLVKASHFMGLKRVTEFLRNNF